MQISKLLPAVCAVAVGAGFMTAQAADDTAAQAAARAALLSKMGVLIAADSQPAQTNQVAAPAASAKPETPQPAVVVPSATQVNIAATKPVDSMGDTAAQAAARQALMAQLAASAQTTVPAATPAAPEPVKTAVVEQPAIVQPPTQVNMIAAKPVDNMGDTAIQAAARQALMAQLAAAAQTAAPVKTTSAAPTMAQPAAVVQPTTQVNAVAAKPVDSMGDTAAQAAARQALLMQLGASSQTAAPTMTQPVVVAPEKTVKTAPVVVATKPVITTPAPLEMQPIVAPPLPITATQEEQLQALLIQYKANQITPEEYHKQRAAILKEK